LLLVLLPVRVTLYFESGPLVVPEAEALLQILAHKKLNSGIATPFQCVSIVPKVCPEIASFGFVPPVSGRVRRMFLPKLKE
jgi:hypothetical protein